MLSPLRSILVAKGSVPRTILELFLVAFVCAPGFALASPRSDDPCAILYATLRSYSSVAQDSKVRSSFVYARPSEILNCTLSVSFDTNRDFGNLDSIVDYFTSFYSLIHAAKNSPDTRLPSNRDIIKDIEALKLQSWATAEEFYSALVLVVDGLNDGHTGIDLGCPPFAHRLALPLVGVVEQGKHVVRAAPLTMLIPGIVQASFSPPFDFDPQPYAGARVNKIDGKPAWEYVLEWVQKNGVGYHDVGQRLNHAFAHLKWTNGSRTLSHGAFATRFLNPGVDYINYTVSREGSHEEEEIRVPWLSYTSKSTLKSLTSAESYYRAFCVPRWKSHGKSSVHPEGSTVEVAFNGKALPEGPTSADVGLLRGALLRKAIPGLDVHIVEKSVSDIVENREQITEDQLSAVAALPLRMARRRGTPKKYRLRSAKVDVKMSKATEISAPHDYWKVYKLHDGKTAVICISNFYPALPTATVKQSLHLLTFYAYATAKALYTADENADRIIIDLSRNGGGATSLIPWVIELIVGSEKYPNPRSSMQNYIHFLADTDLVRQLRVNALGAYSWSGWAGRDEVPFNETTQGNFFYPLESLSIGEPGMYSSFFKEKIPSISELLGVKFSSAWGSKPFMLFSDGQCFSACSSFAVNMKLRFGVKLISIGGLLNRPMAFSAAGGGFVTENVEADILPSFSSKISAMQEAPEPFGMQMNLAMRWTNGFFDETSSAPIEFTFIPADKKLEYTIDNLADPSLQYMEAAKFF